MTTISASLSRSLAVMLRWAFSAVQPATSLVNVRKCLKLFQFKWGGATVRASHGRSETARTKRNVTVKGSGTSAKLAVGNGNYVIHANAGATIVAGDQTINLFGSGHEVAATMPAAVRLTSVRTVRASGRRP
jgi:hypothetical protein